MHSKIKEICDVLDQTADYCESQAQVHNIQGTFIEPRGWHHPAISTKDIVQRPRDLAKKIASANIETLDALDESTLDVVPTRLALLQSQQNITHIFNGNGHQAIPSFLITLDWIEKIFDPIFGYENHSNPLIPKKLRRKIDSISARIDSLDIDTDELEITMSLIQQAHETAENLPTDLAELNKARKAVERTFSDIEQLAEDAKERSEAILEQSGAAKKLLEDSEKTYSIAVTKGLAGAFHGRAKSLVISMWIWVAGLLGALFFALITGKDRFKTLAELISAENPNIELVVIQLAFSLVSLGAPIWFAWLSTKQIGQNFRLAEDYSFKASMAKAYEGYRREAARIDPAMEAKLLYSALDRLDEAPLRYVDDSYHATPWQELISSPEFRQAIENIPELKNKFMDIINKSIPENLKKGI